MVGSAVGVVLVIALAMCAKRKRNNTRRDTIGPSVPQAVAQAALELADNCTITGVSEAARLIRLLVNLVQDTGGNATSVDRNLKRCQSMIDMLRTAATVLDKVRWSGNSGVYYLALA